MPNDNVVNFSCVDDTAVFHTLDSTPIDTKVLEKIQGKNTLANCKVSKQTSLGLCWIVPLILAGVPNVHERVERNVYRLETDWVLWQLVVRCRHVLRAGSASENRIFRKYYLCLSIKTW